VRISSYVIRLVPLSALVAGFVLVACSSDPAPITNKKDSGSNDSGTSGDGRVAPFPSFTDDVMGVVVTQCSLSACHGSKQSNLNIYLPNDPDTVYAELQKTSPTTGLKFVEPGDPTKSYFMIKLDGQQATLSAKCDGGDCGTEMPPDVGLVPKDQRDAIRQWITNGAKRN